MENLIKQISMRMFHVEEENEAQTSRVIRDRKVSSRRTRSFKDSRKGQSWSRKQPSHDASRDNDRTEGEEFRTAVAAAAFAINSIDNKQQIKHDPIIVHSNSKPKKLFSEIVEVPPRPKVNEDLPSEANQQKPASVNTKTAEKVLVKTTSSTSSVEKTPSFVANKQSDEKTSQKESEPRLGKADLWEKAQMEKTKERHMKVKERIFEWENAKKSKAKNKLIRKEGKLEWKRAQALQDFTRKMETVEKISKGARSRNEENQKKEENRVIEKAMMIRSKGKIYRPMFLC